MAGYDELTDRVLRLGYFPHRKIAEDAVKAVVGTFLSQLSEDEALELSAYFPEHLKEWELHQHKARALTITQDEFTENICKQFSLGTVEAQELIHAVLGGIAERLEPPLRERVEHTPGGTELWKQ